jgi:hypothetical protein
MIIINCNCECQIYSRKVEGKVFPETLCCDVIKTNVKYTESCYYDFIGNDPPKNMLS